MFSRCSRQPRLVDVYQHARELLCGQTDTQKHTGYHNTHLLINNLAFSLKHVLINSCLLVLSVLPRLYTLTHR